MGFQMRKQMVVAIALVVSGLSCLILMGDHIIWTPGEGGTCSKTVGGCSKQWHCNLGTKDPVVCYAGYKSIPTGSLCRYRAKRSYAFDPPKCYYNTNTQVYGCVHLIQILPSYSWEPHPENPGNCPQDPGIGAPGEIDFHRVSCDTDELKDEIVPIGDLCD